MCYLFEKIKYGRYISEKIQNYPNAHIEIFCSHFIKDNERRELIKNSLKKNNKYPKI